MGAFHFPRGKSGASVASLKDTSSENVAEGGVSRSNVAKLDALIPAMRDVRLRRILQIIESHPTRKINDLAVECNLSPSHLQHLFKQRTGLGLGQLLTEQRMQYASEFLAHTDLSIKEIAGSVGYEHTSSFTRAFERRFQQAPSYYRQANSLEKK
jgi:AraC-like DNA-binding protein